MTHQQRVVHRLRIAKGHLDTVLRMAEDGKYCIDVINQSRAIQSALKEIDYLLLENHLQTCVVDLVNKGKAKRSAEEIMTLFRNHDK
ncbi:MAG: metal-sensing transcriptional repressor [Candidatus Levybacteria bacterium]|nr:metal-sensing transcriptional repressor [Candidatus Levybacteria bacterium]